jgi:hypothetical protein
MFGVCGGGGGPDDDAGIDADTSGPHNRAFLSDPIVVMGKTLTELDAHCKTGAPAGNYVAWFSDTNATAAARLGDHHGWMRSDGKPFANTITELLAGKIYYPLRVDKTGAEVPVASMASGVPVATATRANGSWAGSSCLGAGMGPLISGVADGTSGTWTDYEYGSLGCNMNVRLYCLQVDHAGDIAAPTDSGRLVFITKQTVSGSTGIDSMDQLCTNEAGKPAVAIVSRPNTAARSRIPTGMPLVRPDGVVAFDATGRQLAPINVTTDRQYIDSQTWAGAQDLDAVPGNETCEDWWDFSGFAVGRTGHTSRSLETAFGSVHVGGCSPSLPIRCVVL